MPRKTSQIKLCEQNFNLILLALIYDAAVVKKAEQMLNKFSSKSLLDAQDKRLLQFSNIIRNKLIKRHPARILK